VNCDEMNRDVDRDYPRTGTAIDFRASHED